MSTFVRYGEKSEKMLFFDWLLDPLSQSKGAVRDEGGRECICLGHQDEVTCRKRSRESETKYNNNKGKETKIHMK